MGGAAAMAFIRPRDVLAQDKPVKGGVVRVVAQAEPSALVELVTGAGAASGSGRVNEGLITVGLDDKVAPLLATSWDVSEDGKTFTFHLRQGVKWHDGQPFTSKDVVHSIEMLKQFHPRRRATFASFVEGDYSDPAKAVLKFSKPAPFLLRALTSYASPMFPAHLYEGTDPLKNPYNNKPVGTGPFRFVEWQRGSHHVFEANPDYWSPDRPNVEAVITRFIPDTAARAAAFAAGEIDVGYNAPVAFDEMKKLVAAGSHEIITDGYNLSGTLNQIFFNLSTPQLQKREVREAIAHAIDLDNYIKVVWDGYAVPAATCISPQTTAFHDASIKPYAFDVEKANALLDAAGFPRGADGMRFSLRLTATPSNSRVPQGAIFIRSALAAIGIDIRIQNYDFATYVKKVYTERDFDLDTQVLVSGYDPTDGVERGYHSRNIKVGLPFSNQSGYSNPRVDELFDLAAAENDEAKRRELYFELQKIVYDDLPAVNLVSFQQITLASKKLHDHCIDQLNFASSFAEAWVEA
jgi:peptide/nickel transport system substrate-binding protein